MILFALQAFAGFVAVRAPTPTKRRIPLSNDDFTTMLISFYSSFQEGEKDKGKRTRSGEMRINHAIYHILSSLGDKKPWNDGKEVGFAAPSRKTNVVDEGQIISNE